MQAFRMTQEKLVVTSQAYGHTPTQREVRTPLAYVGIWLLLTAYWASQLRSVPEPGAQSSPAATPVGDLSAADVVEIEIQSDGQSLHAILVDGRWEVVFARGLRGDTLAERSFPGP